MQVFSFKSSVIRFLCLLVGNESLTACQKINQSMQDVTAASSSASTTRASKISSSSKEQRNTSSHASQQPLPVIYPFSEWHRQPLTNTPTLQDSEAIKQQLGQTLRTDRKSLDYASNLATKYSFALEATPHLDLIDSKNYLEFQWYFADAYDNAHDKKASIVYAQKIFQVTRHWFDKDGSKVIENMLQGEIIHNQTYHGTTVVLAKCEYYNCNLIIKKPSTNKLQNHTSNVAAPAKNNAENITYPIAKQYKHEVRS